MMIVTMILKVTMKIRPMIMPMIMMIIPMIIIVIDDYDGYTNLCIDNVEEMIFVDDFVDQMITKMLLIK